MRKLILASLTISSTLAAQVPPPRTVPLRGSLARRLAALLDQPPFDRASWGVYVTDYRGRVLFDRNGERYSVPASNTKLVVTAAAAVLLPPDYRVTTSLYANGAVENGVLQGDLVLYGRGDPTFSTRCYSTDTLAPGACDSSMTAFRALADSVRAHGIRRVAGKVVGDGSYFEPVLVHPDWGGWDLNWWYAAPISGLGFNDNSIDFRITPGDSVDQPPRITRLERRHDGDVLRQARLAVDNRGDTANDHPLHTGRVEGRCEEGDQVSRAHCGRSLGRHSLRPIHRIRDVASGPLPSSRPTPDPTARPHRRACRPGSSRDSDVPGARQPRSIHHPGRTS